MRARNSDLAVEVKRLHAALAEQERTHAKAALAHTAISPRGALRYPYDLAARMPKGATNHQVIKCQ